MRENNYIVYMHRNKANNKLYFGITSNNPKYRWNNGKGYYNQKISKDIAEYGWENFEHKILFENLSKDKAEKIESMLISKYKTYDDKYGYNVSRLKSGGFPCSNETKLKISNANKGEKNYMYGKHHSGDIKIKISESSKKMWNDENRKVQLSEKMKGNKYGFEKGHIPWNKGLKGIRLSNCGFEKGHIPPFKGKKVPYEIYKNKCKKVLCIETNEIFVSVNEAQRAKHCSNISQVCKGLRDIAGGYHWRYYEE